MIDVSELFLQMTEELINAGIYVVPSPERTVSSYHLCTVLEERIADYRAQYELAASTDHKDQ
ncbi:MAG: hypothetical protein IKI62_05025 [Clostridia bacterium]|nr:hypothetical protein [Clostridia bacterium]